MTDKLRAAAQAVIDHFRGAARMIRGQRRLRIERLVRANARRAMVIDIIERLVEDPEREDFGPSDMEYWSPLHDALREKLRAALAEPTCKQDLQVAEQDAEPVALFSPGKWTLLLTGKNHGLVGQFGDRFDGHPKYYDRVDVYTASPRREWQSLTDEERLDAFDDYLARTSDGRHLFRHSWSYAEEEREAFDAGVAVAEAALKEKNHV